MVMCAADTASEVLSRAYRTCLPSHALLLLYVTDGCLKHSAGIKDTSLKAAACRYVLASVRVTTKEMALQIHALAVHWVREGLVEAAAVFPTAHLFLQTLPTYGCEHGACPARFVTASQRDVHMDLHFDEAVYMLRRPTIATPSRRSWLLDDTGRATAVDWVGFFQRQRHAMSERRLASQARHYSSAGSIGSIGSIGGSTSAIRASSPLPTRRLAGRGQNPCPVTCSRCGDALPEKQYSDEANEWVLDDCVLVPEDGTVQHAGCSACP
jgi:hypothetical protein